MQRTAEIIQMTGHDDSKARALEVGKAAEHLVCADLILAGYRAFLSDQGLPYDILVDLGNRLIKVQVKATYEPKKVEGINWTKKYTWNVRRAGKGGTRKIAGDEFHILALVALDIRKIAYIAIDDNVPTCVMIRPPGPANIHPAKAPFTAKSIDEFPLSEAMRSIR